MGEKTDLEQRAAELVAEWLARDASVFAEPDVWDRAFDHALARAPFDGRSDDAAADAILAGIDAVRASGAWADRTEGEAAGDRGRSGPATMEACAALRARAARGPAQGTDEWLLARRGFLTATDADKVLGSRAARNSVIFAKCDAEAGPGFSGVFVDGPRGHGSKFEPVSARLYELAHGVAVVPLNYVVHATVPYLAASPDGLVQPAPGGGGDAFRVGRLVEFKNPVRGERGALDAEPKRAWWIQMQMQMEVCGAEEVDFVTTLIRDVDLDALASADSPARGAIVHIARPPLAVAKLDELGRRVPGLADADALPDSMYRYQEPMLSDEGLGPAAIRERACSFARSVLDEFEPLGFRHVGTTFWYMEDMCCNLVPRNRRWFAAVAPALQDTWETIERERASGDWILRAPNRAPKPMEIC